jgi:hypothetical protein
MVGTSLPLKYPCSCEVRPEAISQLEVRMIMIDRLRDTSLAVKEDRERELGLTGGQAESRLIFGWGKATIPNQSLASVNVRRLRSSECGRIQLHTGQDSLLFQLAMPLAGNLILFGDLTLGIFARASITCAPFQPITATKTSLARQ